MSDIDSNYYLIIAGFIAIALEVVIGAATGFDLLLIGIIAVVSGCVGLVVHSLPVALGLVATLSLLYVFVGRKLVHSKLSIKTSTSSVNTLIGKKGHVTKAITKNTPGQVKVDGEVWRATSKTSLSVGDDIYIDTVSGVTLEVSKI